MTGFGAVTTSSDPLSFPTNWTIVDNFDHSDMTVNAAIYNPTLASGITLNSTFASTKRQWLSRTGFGTGKSARHDTTGESGGGSGQSLYHTWYQWTPTYMTTNSMRPVGRTISYPLFPNLGTPSKYSSANTLGQMWRLNTSSGNALWIAIYKTTAAGDPQSQLGVFFTNLAAGKTPDKIIDITGYDTANTTHKLEVYYSLNTNGGLKIIWDDAITTWFTGNTSAVNTNLSDMALFGASNDTSNANDLNYFGGLGGAITYKPA